MASASSEYGLRKVLYNLWKRWGEGRVFRRMMEDLVAAGVEPQAVMLDANPALAGVSSF
ncbi:hypothetical protein JYA60_00610 [Sphingomonas yabuuchiae]|uniref:Transposase n=1 Tax=Sphingomonas yabuuchiae TaxID=172044 RepID=A0AA40ZXD8_9SPHN|nr:hypothetical protein [Sphingomonas yabuuchiae]MBN3556749.1 hypothetical protein [Sphingomonas yabuuchiae]